MSYGTGTDIGTTRFLAANVIYQATNRLLSPETGNEADRGILDDAVLMMDVIASYHTEHDAPFAIEWKAIQDNRAKASQAVPKGHELNPEVIEALRWRELRAMFRSLCRAGKFERAESPEATWKPKVQA